MKKHLDLKLPKGARVWLAYSGGVDSTMLLHLLASRKLARFAAIHVHHGLQPRADAWARGCEQQCAALGVKCLVVRVQVDANDPAGPEAAARKARYAALAAHMGKDDLMLTAHHQDDQAETVLLRLLRGSGVEGLAAMRGVTPFGPGQLVRPLLGVPGAAIREYARAHHLDWIDDPHNVAPRYARSYLRREIFPRLREHWPQAALSLTRAAHHAADAAQLLDELAQLDLGVDGAPPLLSCARLLALSPARRANLLRHWVRARGYEVPGSEAIARITREVLSAREDAQPVLHCGAYEFRRYRDDLYLMEPLPAAPGKAELAWDGRGALALPAGCGRLVSSSRKPLELTVRFMRGGEKLKPAGDRHTRTLKHLFQEAAVPPWMRERVPLLYRDGKLLAVADAWLDGDWAGQLKRARVKIRWETVAGST